MTAYHPDLSAAAVDRHLREALEALRKAEKNTVLWFAEVMHRKLYLELGYSSIHQYAELGLGFKKSKTSQFIRLSRALEDLPALKQSLAENALSWTKAREVTKVATRNTEKAWIREAKKTSRRDLEQTVKAAHKLSKQVRGQNKGQGSLLAVDPTDLRLVKEIPIDMHLRMMPEQFARFEALVEKLRKMGVKGNTEELIIAAMEAMVGEGRDEKKEAADMNGRGEVQRYQERVEDQAGESKFEKNESGENGATEKSGCEEESERRKEYEQRRPGAFTRVNGKSLNGKTTNRTSPYQIVVNACPCCGKASVETSRGAQGISQATLRTILCDTRIKKKGVKNRSSIPPSVRMEVMMRDRYRCQARACGNNRFLNVHHIIPRERGGANDADNLITLCWGCHHTLHELAERREQANNKQAEEQLAGIT